MFLCFLVNYLRKGLRREMKSEERRVKNFLPESHQQKVWRQQILHSSLFTFHLIFHEVGLYGRVAEVCHRDYLACAADVLAFNSGTTSAKPLIPTCGRKIKSLILHPSCSGVEPIDSSHVSIVPFRTVFVCINAMKSAQMDCFLVNRSYRYRSASPIS